MIRLDYRDARPIYEQVRDGLRSLMVTGVLAAGEVTARVQPLMEELRDLGMTREEWTDLWKGGDSDA